MKLKSNRISYGDIKVKIPRGHQAAFALEPNANPSGVIYLPDGSQVLGKLKLVGDEYSVEEIDGIDPAPASWPEIEEGSVNTVCSGEEIYFMLRKDKMLNDTLLDTQYHKFRGCLEIDYFGKRDSIKEAKAIDVLPQNKLGINFIVFFEASIGVGAEDGYIEVPLAYNGAIKGSAVDPRGRVYVVSHNEKSGIDIVYSISEDIKIGEKRLFEPKFTNSEINIISVIERGGITLVKEVFIEK